jgi:hypothetical protein
MDSDQLNLYYDGISTHSDASVSTTNLAFLTTPNGIVRDGANQNFQKRRLSDADFVVTPPRSKTARRAVNGHFRRGSPESSTDVEVPNFTEPTASASNSLELTSPVEEKPAHLLGQGRCSFRMEMDKERLKPEHLDKLYTLDNGRHFCHACLYVLLLYFGCTSHLDPSPIRSIRNEKVVDHSHRPASVSFPKAISPLVLINHYERKHPETCKKFIDLWSRMQT